MIVTDKKKFFIGLVMLIIFTVVLVTIFTPVFGGKNGLEYMDNLYNSISKGSAYYIPKVKKDIESFKGTKVDVTLKLKSAQEAEQVKLLLEKTGTVESTGEKLHFKGELLPMLNNCIDDADKMYHNDAKGVEAKYGYDAKRALFNWDEAFHAMDKDLKKQKKFKEAAILGKVLEKSVEPSYNYYTIEPEKISNKVGIVILSLVFYVLYTVWFGFGIMLLFEGLGLNFDH